MKIKVERKQDDRWTAVVTGISGAIAYGVSQEQAIAKVKALALRILNERLEPGNPRPRFPKYSSWPNEPFFFEEP